LLFFLGHDGNSWPPRTTVRQAAVLSYTWCFHSSKYYRWYLLGQDMQ
jgi:hypothetical protein